MTDFVPKIKKKIARLEAGQDIRLEFTPCNHGRIVAFAEATVDDNGEPIKRKLEIIKPGASKPVAQRTDSGRSIATIVTLDITKSDLRQSESWTCRVVNQSEHTADFALRVSYPSDTPLEVYRVSSPLVEIVLNHLLGGTHILVTRGQNQSRITFPELAGKREIKFTVPDFSAQLLLFTIKEYPNNIESDHIDIKLINANTTYPTGGLRLTVTFKESGREILGTFHGELKNMRMVVELGFCVDRGQISYRRVGANLEFKLKLIGLPDALLDSLLGYSEKIRRTVENTFLSHLERKDVKAAFSSALTERLMSMLPEGSKLHDVRVVRNEVVVEHYRK